MDIELVAVHDYDYDYDYDKAIRLFVDALGFDLIEDSPARTDDGRDKRWVVVRPPGAVTGLLLARVDPHQERVVGDQVAGRVGFFLRVDDFAAAYGRMAAAGVRFVTPPRTELWAGGGLPRRSGQSLGCLRCCMRSGLMLLLVCERALVVTPTVDTVPASGYVRLPFRLAGRTVAQCRVRSSGADRCAGLP